MIMKELLWLLQAPPSMKTHIYEEKTGLWSSTHQIVSYSGNEMQVTPIFRSDPPNQPSMLIPKQVDLVVPTFAVPGQAPSEEGGTDTAWQKNCQSYNFCLSKEAPSWMGTLMALQSETPGHAIWRCNLVGEAFCTKWGSKSDPPSTPRPMKRGTAEGQITPTATRMPCYACPLQEPPATTEDKSFSDNHSQVGGANW